MASLLIAHGVPLDAVDAAGRTARDVALALGNDDVVAMIDFRMLELRGLTEL